MSPSVFYIPAALLAAAALALLLWSLRGDRARGRRRCPRCWYDMADAASLQCPECGRTARSPAHLLRTRRRWKPAIAALALALAAYGLAVWPRVHKAGAIGLIPTTALIWYVPPREPPLRFDAAGRSLSPSAAAAELARRARMDDLREWQWRWLLARTQIIRWRDAWPLHVPLHVSFGLPWWLDNSVPRFSAESPLPGAAATGGSGRPPWRVGDITPTTRSVTVSITDGRRTIRWDIPVRPVERTEDAIQPVTTPELDDAVRRAVRVQFDRERARALQQAGRLPAAKNWSWVIRLDREAGPVPDDIALGFAVDLLRDGEVIRTWSVATGDLPYADDTDFIALVEGVGLGWTDDIPDIHRYAVRVRGDPNSAVADVTRPRCWSGQFTVPLADTIRRPN